jgi:quercetin dioxygenase-like cupin family protein
MRNHGLPEFGIVCTIFAGALFSGCTAKTSPPPKAPPADQPAEPAGTTAALPSKAFLWNDLAVRKLEFGEIRDMFRSPTATLDELEIHATTLNPGQRPHPPHQHPYEEMLLLREGTLEAMVNDRVIPLTAGSVLFLAPNDMHGWQNKGESPASYYIITWRTARTAAK